MNAAPRPAHSHAVKRLVLALFIAMLALSGCSLPRLEGPLATDPVGTVKTLIATLPVDIELPTGMPDMPTILVVPTLPGLPQETPAPGATPAAGESISAYFSNPLANDGSAGPERGLVEAVRQSSQSVDMAIYNISLDSLAAALIDAHQRGVQVRMVMESEAMDRRVPQTLRQAGIPIVGDQREGLMHNKFTIIDGQEVWLGSMNYTESSAYSDFNNLVRIRDAQVAQDYTVNFEEMFTDHHFGPEKQPNTPFPRTDVGGTPVEVYFSPDDGVAAAVLDELYGARQRIDVLAYSFTRDDFADALIDRSRAGVVVRVVFDSEQYESNTGTEYDNLRNAGLDARLDGIPGLMHDKVILIDGQVVITGSYNFSASAERSNDENLVVIHSADLAAQFLEHFEQVYRSAE